MPRWGATIPDNDESTHSAGRKIGIDESKRAWYFTYRLVGNNARPAAGVRMSKKFTGSEILLESLKRQNVDVFFGLPGGAVLPLYDALYSAGIRHMLVRHEQAAAFAADGYARVTGKPGVCLGTSGPGATNLLTGLTSAMMDSIPVVALAGQVPASLIAPADVAVVYRHRVLGYSLREYGNLSSAFVYFVLSAALADSAPGGWWWLSSFGAGFTCHGALLDVA